MTRRRVAVTTGPFYTTTAEIQLAATKRLTDVDWCGLLPGVRWVEIVIVPLVMDELDVKKNDSKDRVRDRARAALPQVDAALRGSFPRGRTLTTSGEPSHSWG